MIWDRTAPCQSCPYRKDAPVGRWQRVEFENLLKHDADPVEGNLFGCHEFRKRPPEEHRPCAGWLLDQKRRDVPSIRLRLVFTWNRDALACFEALSAKGLKLYRSIDAMCRANGVRPEEFRRGAEEV